MTGVDGGRHDGEWQDTVLWKAQLACGGPDTDAVTSTLRQCMPGIEKVLKRGGTAPTDFTLHDSGHGFRVAERMADIIPADVLSKLSAYELALLLLSAYLHDIGMTPEQKRVRHLHSYLLTGEPGDLDQNDRNQFQKWLDDHASGTVPPMAPAAPTADLLRRAGHLITHYCRYRHNDWSEEWIRRHMEGLQLGTYNAWLDDLIALCRSHHYGYEELKDDRFNPRLAGAVAVVVHLRYLAAILRIADILEFDPERTPDVVFRHRDIAPESMIFWWKDHAISMKREGARLVVAARPTSAAIHRAVEMTVDEVDRELELCRRLALETHFEKCPGLRDDLPHRWDLEVPVHRDIKPRETSYEYIDGAFRPNTTKLLELLSGAGLYGSPMVAVRELLQNAFDAVREQLAYERLSQPQPGDPLLGETLGRLHRVELRVELDGDEPWLVCKDTGIGMTKAIIKDQLLVSGSGIRHEVLELERRCQEAGFRLGRTGEFGIGVLSYFMLADRVVIGTRRSLEPGDGEAIGWRFKTDGVGSFGELRVDGAIRRGTEVRLHLRQEVVGGDVILWFARLREYVGSVLVRIPCEFQLNSPLPGCNGVVINPGWVRRIEDRSTMLINQMLQKEKERGRWSTDETPLEMLSESRRKEVEAVGQHWSEVAEEMARSLRWQVQEGALPESLGQYRLHLPYFDLPDGLCLAFLRVRKIEQKIALEAVGKGQAYWPEGFTEIAWKGVRTQLAMGQLEHPRYPDMFFYDRHGIFAEIDLEAPEAGRVLVSRHELVANLPMQAALDWLWNQAVRMRQDFSEKNHTSVYASVNYRTCNIPLRSTGPTYWIRAGKQSNEWERVTFPVMSSLVFVYGQIPTHGMTWRAKEVSILRCLGGPQDDDHYDGLTWNAEDTAPEFVVKRVHYRFSIAPIWARLDKTPKRHAVGLVCAFPPKWKNLVGVEFVEYSGTSKGSSVWNPEHPLLRTAEPQNVEWCRELLGRSLDPLPQRNAVLEVKGRGAAWILLCLQSRQKDMWDGLRDRDPHFLEELWRGLFGRGAFRGNRPVEVYQWVETATKYRLRALSPERWRVCEGSDEVRKCLPDPGMEWTLLSQRDETLGNLARMAPGRIRRTRPGRTGK